MFRLDSKLASYFATLHEGKGGGGAAARAARDELVNFKMRAAGLVEAYCKRVRAMGGGGGSGVGGGGARDGKRCRAQPRTVVHMPCGARRWQPGG